MTEDYEIELYISGKGETYINDIAESVHLSPICFHKLFKNYTGKKLPSYNRFYT